MGFLLCLVRSFVEAHRFSSCGTGGFSCSEARGSLVPQPGMEPVSLVLQGRFLNHWATREAPTNVILAHLLLVDILFI